MGAFEYTALDAQGRERKGLIEGDTPKHVRQLLREKQLLPMEIQEAAQREQKQQPRGAASCAAASRRSIWPCSPASSRRCCVPACRSRSRCRRSPSRPRSRACSGSFSACAARWSKGHPLADGLRDFPQAFPEIYRATVSAGEQSGKLDSVLERLSDYTESRQVMGQQVSNALVYPDRAAGPVVRHRVVPAGLRRAAGGRGVRVRPPGAAHRHPHPDRHERPDPPLLVLRPDRRSRPPSGVSCAGSRRRRRGCAFDRLPAARAARRKAHPRPEYRRDSPAPSAF